MTTLLLQVVSLWVLFNRVQNYKHSAFIQQPKLAAVGPASQTQAMTMTLILQELLYQDSNVTVMQAMVMISSFVTRYGLTNEAFQLLLGIFLLFLPRNSKLPKTLYYFDKIFPVEKVQCKFYCPKCQVSFPRSESGFSFICTCSETLYSQLLRNWWLKIATCSFST